MDARSGLAAVPGLGLPRARPRRPCRRRRYPRSSIPWRDRAAGSRPRCRHRRCPRPSVPQRARAARTCRGPARRTVGGVAGQGHVLLARGKSWLREPTAGPTAVGTVDAGTGGNCPPPCLAKELTTGGTVGGGTGGWAAHGQPRSRTAARPLRASMPRRFVPSFHTSLHQGFHGAGTDLGRSGLAESQNSSILIVVWIERFLTSNLDNHAAAAKILENTRKNHFAAGYAVCRSCVDFAASRTTATIFPGFSTVHSFSPAAFRRPVRRAILVCEPSPRPTPERPPRGRHRRGSKGRRGSPVPSR